MALEIKILFFLGGQLGGESPSGFDSSGLIWFVFKENNIEIPRVHSDTYREGEPISREELLPGNLVFFEGRKPGPFHGGIYIGQGQFIHSPSMGRTPGQLICYFYCKLCNFCNIEEVLGREIR